MYKLATLLFGIFITILTILSLVAPDSHLESFLTLNDTAALLRVCIAFGLVLYAFWNVLHTPYARYFLTATGTLLVLASVTGLYSTSFFGLFDYYLQPLDYFVLLEGGILSLIGGLERQPVPEMATADYTTPANAHRVFSLKPPRRYTPAQ